VKIRATLSKSRKKIFSTAETKKEIRPCHLEGLGEVRDKGADCGERKLTFIKALEKKGKRAENDIGKSKG